MNKKINTDKPSADKDRKNALPGMPSPKGEKKFLPNNQYFTICIYTLVVVTVSALIIRVIMTPYAVSNALRQVAGVLMPFLIGLFIALTLNPIISRFHQILHENLHIKKEGVCKAVSIVAAYLIVLGLFAVCVGYILPQIVVSVTEVVNSLPQLYKMTYDFFNNLQSWFPNADVSELQKMVNTLLPEIIEALKQFTGNMVPALYTASISVIRITLNIIIAIIVSVYMMIDKNQLIAFMKKLVYGFVPENSIPITLDIFSECNRIFTNFIAGKAIDSLIIGILCFILMSIFRMPYALLISVIVGITNMIPYFGPFIGAVPGVLVILMISPWRAIGFVIMIIVLQQFDGLYLGPKILGDNVGIKPLWIIVSITIGGSLGGILGMFLGVPIFAMLSYLLELLLEYRLKKRNIRTK